MARIYTDKKGYKRFSDSDRLVHRWVAEKKIGGKIGRGRVVHHIDGDKGNFRKDNVWVKDNRQHSRDHAKRRRRETNYGFW